METLIQEIYQILKDYRADEGKESVTITPDKIKNWVSQFEESDREFLLRACSGILKPGVVSNFVVTKHQSNDQTVRRTNRLPVGCNIRIFQLKTQAQTGFAQHLQRLVVYG